MMSLTLLERMSVTRKITGEHSNFFFSQYYWLKKKLESNVIALVLHCFALVLHLNCTALSQSASSNFCMYIIRSQIIYMQKLLEADWLRDSAFMCNSVQLHL